MDAFDYKTRNFNLKEVVLRTKGFPKELFPIAYIALGYIQGLRDALTVYRGEDTPIIITSGYRSPAYNQEIGGAVNSYHMWRSTPQKEIIWALDIMSPKMSIEELYEFCSLYVIGETYLHSKLSFVHIAPFGDDETWII